MNPNEEGKSKVEDLSDTLYSRTRYRSPVENRHGVKPIEQVGGAPEVEEKWHSPELAEVLTHERRNQEGASFIKKFFIFALLFFTATIVVAGFVFFGGVNFISSKNVDIEVVGPTLASAGEVLDLGITIKNENNTDLEFANFSVQYPTGSRESADSSKTLTYTKDDLGVIEAGDEVARNVRLVLIGATGEVKDFKFSVEYKVKGSNATFYKDKVYQVTIGSAPLTLNVDSPASVSSGESFSTKVSVTFNSTEVLKNVMLRVEYPYGYSVENASPPALGENNVWTLGDLTPGSAKEIEIRGRLVGENQDERTMRFYVGVGEAGAITPNFKTVVISTQNTVAIEKPSIGLSVSFNSESNPIYVAPAGRPISTSVRFQNNLPERLINPKLEVRFSGPALNKQTISAQDSGFYDSSTSRINWNIINTEGSSELLPGDDDRVSFEFSSIAEAATLSNRDIILEFILMGTPTGTNSPITVRETRTVKIASQVTLSARATYSIGPFVNTGPIPPKVDTETTYSAVWSIGNTQSDINNARVTAKLGPGVKWIGAHSSLSEDLSYDEGSNTVTWNMGTLNADTGFTGSPREVAFRVALKPSISQIGSAPVLVSNIIFSGFDTLAEKDLSITNANLTTKISSDPAFIQGDDIVVK